MLPDNERVKVGMTSSLKNDAQDAGRLAAQLVAKDTQDMDSVVLAEGQVMYKTRGEPVFNCRSGSGEAIEFKGGRYLTDIDNTDICEALDYFCSKGRLVKEEKEPEAVKEVEPAKLDIQL